MPGGNPIPRSIHAILTPLAIAIIIGGLLLSHEVRALVKGIVVFTVALAALISMGRLLANLVVGLRCPECGRPRLARAEVQTMGDRFYECDGCGARLARTAFGSWRDVSGPEYAHRFARGIVLDPWTRTRAADLAPEPEPPLDPNSTHAALLRRKRQRTPEPPNGPGLVP